MQFMAPLSFVTSCAHIGNKNVNSMWKFLHIIAPSRFNLIEFMLIYTQMPGIQSVDYVNCVQCINLFMKQISQYRNVLSG